MIELRASIHACMRVRDLPDNVIRLTQFTMTSPTLRRRTSEPNTRTVSLMALITISPILAWARLICHMRAPCSRRTRSRVTCFPMLDLSLIPSSSVKRLRPFDYSNVCSSRLTCTVLVCQASSRTVQHDVFIRGACHSYVSLIFPFNFILNTYPYNFRKAFSAHLTGM